MATKILLYDYSEIDPYWGFEETFVIGYGSLTASAVGSQIDAASGDLDVCINSQGGKVFDGWAIYNKLKAYDRGRVNVQVDGIAASIASIIAMAGETVTMMQASMMMVHKPTGFYIGAMDADELASEAQSLTEIEAVLIDVYAGKTGLSTTKLQNLIDATTWLSPDNAVALGFADVVQKAEKKPTIPQNVFDRLFTNTSESTRAYMNSAFTIKTNSTNMSTTVKDLAEKQDKTNSLLEDFVNFFKGTKKNEGEETETPPVEETTEGEQTTEPTVEELKAEIAALKAEKTADADKVNNAQSILDKANKMYDTVQTQLAEIKSNYKPAEKANDFNSKEDNAGVDISAEARAERKKQYSNKK